MTMPDQTLVDLHASLEATVAAATARVAVLEADLAAAQAQLAAKSPPDTVRQTVADLIAADEALMDGQPGAQLAARATLLSAGVRRLRDLLAV
jgi:hypothetical protein